MPQLPTEAVMLLVVGGALCALAVVRGVHRGYVSELQESLRRGRVEIREEDVLDRTTLQTIATSRASSTALGKPKSSDTGVSTAPTLRQRLSSLRLESCSLRSTADAWVSTVLIEIVSCRAISLYV